MSNKGKKSGPRPNGKPTRAELSGPFNAISQELSELRIALAWTVELLIDKKFFTAEELKTFFEKMKEKALAAQTAPAAIQLPASSEEANIEAAAAERLAAEREQLVNQ